MSPTASRTVLLALALVAGTGCAPSPGRHPAAPARATTTTLVVTNHYWAPLRIFLVNGPVGTRIGEIQPGERRVFAITNAQLGSGVQLRLRAQAAVTREEYTSEVFTVVAGGRIAWRIETALRHSSLTHP